MPNLNTETTPRIDYDAARVRLEAVNNPTMVLVERVTCEGCQDAINRRLASARLHADLEHNWGRLGDGRPKAAQCGDE